MNLVVNPPRVIAGRGSSSPCPYSEKEKVYKPAASASEGGKTAIKTTTRARASAPHAPARSGHAPGQAQAALSPGGRLPTAPGAHWWCVRGHHLASQKIGSLKCHGVFLKKNVRDFKEEFGTLFPVRLVSIPPRFAVITNNTVEDRPILTTFRYKQANTINSVFQLMWHEKKVTWHAILPVWNAS